MKIYSGNKDFRFNQINDNRSNESKSTSGKDALPINYSSNKQPLIRVDPPVHSYPAYTKAINVILKIIGGFIIIFTFIVSIIAIYYFNSPGTSDYVEYYWWVYRFLIAFEIVYGILCLYIGFKKRMGLYFKVFAALIIIYGIWMYYSDLLFTIITPTINITIGIIYILYSLERSKGHLKITGIIIGGLIAFSCIIWIGLFFNLNTYFSVAFITNTMIGISCIDITNAKLTIGNLLIILSGLMAALLVIDIIIFTGV